MNAPHAIRPEGDNLATKWNTGEPPKDGQPIVVVARIITTYGKETSVEEVCAVIYWQEVPGWSGWTYRFGDGLGVTIWPSDKFIIEFWMLYPKEVK